MIEIINICPVCRTTSVFRFRKEDADVFDDAPWNVPCGECQAKLEDRIKSIDGANANRVYVNLLFGCQTGCEGCLDMARHLVGVPESAMSTQCRRFHLPTLPPMKAAG